MSLHVDVDYLAKPYDKTHPIWMMLVYWEDLYA